MSTTALSGSRYGYRSTVGTRAARITQDVRRPRSSAWHPGAPGGRPHQPSHPVGKVLVSATVRPASVASLEGRPVAGGLLNLNDRGLAVLMAGFLLALLLGAAVMVSQFVAIPTASPQGDDVARTSAVGALA